jgi:hypothetical protein
MEKAMKTTEITDKNFGTKLGDWKRSAGSMRQGLQDMVVFALSVYRDVGDAGYLSRLVVAANETKGVNGKLFLDFVRGHANVTWQHEKGSFRKSGGKGEPASVTMPSTNWWEFDKPRNESDKGKTIDVNKRLASLLDAIEKADDIAVDHKTARELLHKIEQAINPVKAVAA